MLLTNKYVWIGGAVAAVAAVLLAKKAAGAIGDAANAVNPMNPDNVINQAATGVYQDVTGSTGTIGGDIYDATHDSNGQAAWWWDWRMLTPTTAAGMAGEKAGGALHDAGEWLGGAIYDWVH